MGWVRVFVCVCVNPVSGFFGCARKRSVRRSCGEIDASQAISLSSFFFFFLTCRVTVFASVCDVMVIEAARDFFVFCVCAC